MQDKLHADLEHKDMALEIDRDCAEMHNDAIDIKVREEVKEALFMAFSHPTLVKE